MPAISVEELFPTRKQKNLDNSIVESVLGMIITVPDLLKKVVQLRVTKILFTEEVPLFPSSLHFN